MRQDCINTLNNYVVAIIGIVALVYTLIARIDNLFAIIMEARIQFVSATLVFGLAAFDCSLAISSSHTSLGVL